MQGLAEFQTEARLLPQLSHSNLVQLLGTSSSGGRHCLVYELMTNGNLEDRLKVG